MKASATQRPDWVLRHKVPGTEIRLINNRYYLYKISSKWCKEKKRTIKVTENLLGRITETGFVPSRARVSTAKLSQISVLEYGMFDFVFTQNQDLYTKLQQFFPAHAKELLIFAIFRLAYQSPLKHMLFYYENSYASETLSGARLTDKAISELFKTVGAQRTQITALLKDLMQDSNYLLIDQTHVVSYSEQMGSNKVGYNSQRSFDPQVNLLLLFSPENKMPCFYRLTSGDIRELTALQKTVQEIGLPQAIVIGDKGFYSAKNAEYLSKQQLSYILPLKRNHTLCDYTVVKTGNKKDFSGWFSFENRAIWYHTQYKDGQTILLYLDERLRTTEQQDYLQRIESQKEGYTTERFFEKQYQLGTITLCCYLANKTVGIPTSETPKEKLTAYISPQKVFEYYKSRNEIEIAFDAYKNTLEADRTYMRGSKEMETWTLVNFLALRMYYQVYYSLMNKGLLKKYTPSDVLLFLKQIKKLKISNQWVTAETTKKTQTLLNLLRI